MDLMLSKGLTFRTIVLLERFKVLYSCKNSEESSLLVDKEPTICLLRFAYRSSC